MKAVKRFKDLLFRKRPESMEGIFGRSSRLVAPPGHYRPAIEHRKTQSVNSNDRRPVERSLAVEGIHHDIDVFEDNTCRPRPMNESSTVEHNPASQVHNKFDKQSGDAEAAPTPASPKTTESSGRQTPTPIDRAKGHAHDPLTDVLFLDIGAGINTPPPEQEVDHVLSESPGATETNVYETAYEEEMQRILARRGREPTIYLTRRVEGIQSIRNHESVIRGDSSGPGQAGSGLATMVQKVKEHKDNEDGEISGKSEEDVKDQSVSGLAGLIKKVKEHDEHRQEGTQEGHADGQS